MRAAEQNAGLGETLTAAAARAYHKLLAVKDEWEVARLIAAPEFATTLAGTFEGPYKLHFHIGAWPFARPHPQTGVMGKGEAGSWAMTAFRVVAKLRFLRGTWLDPFRNSAERKLERRLVAEFEADVDDVIARLSAANHALAVRLLGVPETIKGYGRVKEASAADAARRAPRRSASSRRRRHRWRWRHDCKGQDDRRDRGVRRAWGSGRRSGGEAGGVRWRRSTTRPRRRPGFASGWGRKR